MNREVKKSNIWLTIVIFILIILGISTISNATDHGKNVNVSMNNIRVNDTFNLSMNEYDNNVNRLLCIEHNQKLSHWTYNEYKVKAKVKIEGDSCERRRSYWRCKWMECEISCCNSLYKWSRQT